MIRTILSLVSGLLLIPTSAEAQNTVTITFTGTVEQVADPGAAAYPSERVVIGSTGIESGDRITGSVTYTVNPMNLVKSNGITGIYTFTDRPTEISMSINGIEMKTLLKPPYSPHSPHAKIVVSDGSTEEPSEALTFFYHDIAAYEAAGTPLNIEAFAMIEFLNVDGGALNAHVLPEKMEKAAWPAAGGKILITTPASGSASEFDHMPSEVVFTINSWSDSITPEPSVRRVAVQW